MNNARRKELKKAFALLCSAYDIINEVREEEQEAFDNLPESFQYGERGEKMEETIYTLEEMVDAIEEAYTNIEEITEG